MKSEYRDILIQPSIHPASLSGAKTGDAIVDLQGYESALIICQSGAISTTTVVELKHGDQPNLSDAAAVTDSDLDPTSGAEPTFTATTDNNKIKTFAYKGSKRYLRVDTTAGAGLFGASIEKSHARHAPVN